jgi:uncharacterized protein YcaQ
MNAWTLLTFPGHPHSYSPAPMPPRKQQLRQISIAEARRIWLRAQRLDTPAPFGSGPDATQRAVEHLGYVQIDTINVIERCHHHILFTRIPDYDRADLQTAQSQHKTVFEYWTHALSYVPVRDLRYFLPAMKRYRQSPHSWFKPVMKKDYAKVIRLIRENGALSIRDIDDDELVEKDHPWASRKPSKRALQLAFYTGVVTISARTGMLKTYELMDRHFGWETRPKPATERQIADYLLDRALTAQGLVSLDSICYLNAKAKPAVRKAVEARLRRKELVPLSIEGDDRSAYWARPETFAIEDDEPPALTHILSPFDPLVIQRNRLKQFFGYEHRFEAYVPKEKRIFGYFGLPVLLGDKIVAVLDLKADRQQRELLIQQWTWVGDGSPRAHKQAIEEELGRFERFQLA